MYEMIEERLTEYPKNYFHLLKIIICILFIGAVIDKYKMYQLK